MGALFGLGIDNALIEIDNEEVPILDGSAKEFIEKIILAGIKVSEAPIKIIKINKKVEFKKAKTKNKTELTGFFEKMTEMHVTIKKDAKK